MTSLIQKFIDGYNATVLAYGQTGSGKTFTMGTGLDTMRDFNTDMQGIVPRAIHDLYRLLEEKRSKFLAEGKTFQFQVLVSFLELYNEELIDSF